MSGSPWKPVRRLWPLALAVLALLGWKPMSASAAPPPSRTFAVPPAPNQQTTPVPNGRSETAICECESNFWIVSSRRCPQKAGRGCVGCRFDHFHYTTRGCEFQKSAQAFHNWLQPGVPICVIVHGSFVSFDGLMMETRQMARWIRSANPGRPLQIVYFTWPSDGPFTGLFQLDIAKLGRRSAFNGIYLSQFITTLPKHADISLIGHSHGARMVSAALHLLGGGTVQNFRLCRPSQCSRKLRVVYLAAAFDHHWLNPGERYDRAFCPVEALLNVRNESDLPLLFYPLRRPFSHRALARTGFTKKDRRKLGDALAKIAELDVTPQVGRRHLWQYYFQKPEIAAAISPYIFFTDRQAVPVPTPLPVQQHTRWPVQTPSREARFVKPVTSGGWRPSRTASRRSVDRVRR